MPTYQYVDPKTGQLTTKEAPDVATALQGTGQSGVRPYTPPTTSTSVSNTSTTPPQPPAYVEPDWVKQMRGESSATPTEAYGLTAEEQARLAESKKAYNSPQQTPDEIFLEKQRQYQYEIDAVNKLFANTLAEAKTAGLNRAGSAGARQARGGLLGSDFGAAQDKKVDDYNADTLDNIRQQQSLKISEIFGQIRKGAEEDLAAKRKARDEDYNTYVGLLNTSSARKKDRTTTAAKALAAAGVTPEQLATFDFGKPEFQGLNINDIKSAFNEEYKEKTKEQLATKKTESEIAKAQEFTLTPGQTRYGVDPKTGKTVVLASVPKTVASKGSIPSNPKGTIVSGNYKLNPTEFTTLNTNLNKMRGADGYLDPVTYKDLYNSWVNEKGGKEADFLKYFPPTRYVNPLATDLPLFLQNTKNRTKASTEVGA